jgi:hypothetical protein
MESAVGIPQIAVLAATEAADKEEEAMLSAEL